MSVYEFYRREATFISTSSSFFPEDNWFNKTDVIQAFIF